jgi:hypothetical protein
MKWQGGRNIYHYVWAPYPSTPSPYQFTKVKARYREAIHRQLRRWPWDYKRHWSSTTTIPLRLPSGTGNFNLEPQLYNLLDATHHHINLRNTPLAGDCWLCLSSVSLLYVVIPVSPLNQSMHDATHNSTSTKPKVSNIQLSQRAPNCIYNSSG